MLNRNQTAFVKAAEDLFGVGSILTRDGISHVCKENDLSFPYWFVTKSEYRHDRGRYKLPNIGTQRKVVEPEPEAVEMDLAVVALRQPKLVDDSDVSIPQEYPDYVPFGFYNDLRNIIKSGDFYPVLLLVYLEMVKHSWSSKLLLDLSVSALGLTFRLKLMKVTCWVVLLLSMVTWLTVMVQFFKL